ncbi:hypothetical protein H8E88_27335 [candidate division KSB1 bacterium]|nr:hypothetical protein [candidate division KSB1 bacterium]
MTETILKNNKYGISEDILHATKKCTDNFICLEIDRENLCQLEVEIEYNTTMYICKHENSCNYKLNCHKLESGEISLCTCPTRIEIYKRYKI